MIARFLLPAIAGAALLSGCSETQPVADEGAPTVRCALDGAADWSDDCRLETRRVGGANVLVIRHPDGSFRRLVEGETELRPADGMETATSERHDGRVIVTIGDDRYDLQDGSAP